MSQSLPPARVLILGGGIIGLSSANLLQDKWNSDERTSKRELHITILTDLLTPHTTGDVAGGIWTPSAIDDPDHEKIKRWASMTYKWFSESLSDTNGRQHALRIQQTPAFWMFTENKKLPFWAEIVPGMRQMTKEELDMFPAYHPQSGYHYMSYVVDAKSLNAWLMQRFLTRGGSLIAGRRLESINDVPSEDYDLVVNCLGYGAATVFNDTRMFPIRGQIHRVRAPWQRAYIKLNTDFYIIPGFEYTVIGGTYQKKDATLEVRDNDKARIVEGCTRLLPGLQQAIQEGTVDQVGLRPGRDAIRLEFEHLVQPRTGRTLKVIHNYGHGGSGFTLFWGCAHDVFELVADYQLSTNKTQ